MMKTKDIIRIIWSLENKYNQNKRFCFFQELRQALNKEIKTSEEEGIYYKAYNNLLELKESLI